VNAAQGSGRFGTGKIGGILDRLLAHRFFEHPGNRYVFGNEGLNLFLYELFLYAIAQLIDSEEFKLAGSLLDRPYPTGDLNHGSGRQLPTFTTFYTHSQILSQYNSTQSQHYDYQAVLITERWTLHHLPLSLLVQSDILLAVRAIVKQEDSWHPRMLFFRESLPGLPLFAEAQREQGFANLAVLLGIISRQELAAAFAKRIEEGKHALSHWGKTGVIANIISLSSIVGS
jgi:hypothetical protein